MKILVVSCVGGHLTEVMQLAPVLRRHETVLVVDDAVQLPDFPSPAPTASRTGSATGACWPRWHRPPPSWPRSART